MWLVGRNVGVIMYSFHVNISSTMSCGVLECDVVMLANDMLMSL